MQKHHSWFFYLCALEGAAAIAALFLIPSEGGRLSLARLALLSLILALCLVWIVVGLRPPSLLHKLNHPAFIILFAVLSLTFGLLLFLLRYLNPESSLSAYERLSPLLWYLLILSIQFFFYILILQKGFHLETLSTNKLVYLSALTAFCLLFLLFIFISLTRIGLTPDPAYWGEPGVPMFTFS